MRFPDDRFLFLEGSLQGSIFGSDNPELKQVAIRKLDQFRGRDIKPKYFYFNNRRPSVGFIDAIKLWRHFRWSNDETKYSTCRLILNKICSIFNYMGMRVYENRMIKTPPSGKYVLLTLHKQPEASIDLLDYWNSNQYLLIRCLSLSLPLDFKLVVKEHSNALGDRGYGFFKSVLKYDNVILAHYSSSIRDFLMSADVVVSVSGTACLESALLGKRAICTSDIFFKDMLSLSNCSIKDIAFLAKDGFRNLLRKNENFIEAEYVRIFMKSHEGKVSDIITDPTVMSDVNLKAVAKALISVMEHINKFRAQDLSRQIVA